jgi:hemolysin-activating ACP:hemolysin acyltransferase
MSTFQSMLSRAFFHIFVLLKASLKHSFCILFFFAVTDLAAQKKDSVVVPTISNNQFELVKQRHNAFFISDRFTEDEKYEIFKIASYNETASTIIVSGYFQVVGNPNQKRASIRVFNASNGELVGIYNTNPITGNYLVVLVPNVMYVFKIEVQGYGSWEELVEVPLRTDFEICRQDISVKIDHNNKPVYYVNNFFVDENEKVLYLKGRPDTLRMIPEAISISAIRAQAKKDKKVSTIDDLVKS